MGRELALVDSGGACVGTVLAALKERDGLAAPGSSRREEFWCSGSREDFAASVEAILKARRVYIMGSRSTSVLASFLGHYLRHMLDAVHVVTSSGASEMFEQIIGIGPEDVVVAFSFPRYSTATFKGAQFCQNVGAKVIGVTDSALSPLGRSSDHVLLCKSDMISLVDSLTAPFSVANALIVAIAARRERELAKTFSSLENVWEEYQVYEKRVEL